MSYDEKLAEAWELFASYAKWDPENPIDQQLIGAVLYWRDQTVLHENAPDLFEEEGVA